MLPTTFRCSTAPKRNVRAITQDISPFLYNLIFQYTNPLLFETEPHSLHTIRLLREHLDFYLYYINYRTYEITPSQTQSQVILKSVENVITGTYYRTIYPKLYNLQYKTFSTII